MDKRLYKPGGNEARSSTSHTNCLCLPFFLFCFVEFFCELLLDESSLRFAFSSCRMNFPETQFQSCKNYGGKKNAKNEIKLGRGKNLQENL